MEKPKEPVKVIKFDKVTAQLHVHIETENNLVSTKDKKLKTGHTQTVLTQVIFKEGIKELLLTLEEQKKKHTDALERATSMMDGEKVALGMIEKDLKSIKDAIGDLKFKEDDKPKSEPTSKSV